MIKANPTIFKFYLSIMDSLSEYLSNKYTEASLDNPNHYKTIIIQKIVRMFHTLERLVEESQDEVSARCVLRGILDSVTTYCFIYQRDDRNEMMFRHYLYILDGLSTYKRGIIDGIMEDGENKFKFEYACDEAIKQIKRENVLGKDFFKGIEENNTRKSRRREKIAKIKKIKDKIGNDMRYDKYYDDYDYLNMHNKNNGTTRNKNRHKNQIGEI